MNNLRICLLTFVILVLPVAVPAQDSRSSQEGLPELLVSVDESEMQAIRTANDYFIKSRSYFTKRHRIVRINKKVLETGDPFTISLFEGTTVTAKRESIKDIENVSVHWRGKIIAPEYPMSELENSGMPEGEAVVLWESLISFSIVGASYDRDIATGQSFPSQSKRSAQGYTRPSDPSQISPSEFYSFAFDVSTPSIASTYHIRPLDATPEFHIVYEADPSKEYSVELTTNEENERRRNAHEAFKSTLGEDPRILWSLRHAESQQ